MFYIKNNTLISIHYKIKLVFVSSPQNYSFWSNHALRLYTIAGAREHSLAYVCKIKSEFSAWETHWAGVCA